MKVKVFAVFVIFLIFPLATKVLAQDFAQVSSAQKKLILPQDNSLYSKDLAISLLELSSGHSAKNTKRIFENYNFEVLRQVNYEKEKNQIDHTSAYTFAKGKIFVQQEKSENQVQNQEKIFDAYLIVIRGTDGNEFYSDFDFAPSVLTSDLISASSSVASSATNLIGESDENKESNAGDKSDKNNPNFAYNFLYSAEDIFLDFQNFVQEKNPIIILAGHSRGAAVANLLAVLLNQVYDSSKIFAYTFACPQTIKTSLNFTDYNIFNFINSSDIVPYLPLSFWGFKRAGKDIFLDEDFSSGFSNSETSENLQTLDFNFSGGTSDFTSSFDSDSTSSSSLNARKINQFLTSIYKICPTINSYYNEKHSLVSRGLSDDGLSLYEVSLALCTQLSKFSVNNLDFADFTDFENLSDEDFFNLQNVQNLNDKIFFDDKKLQSQSESSKQNGENFSSENQNLQDQKSATELKNFSLPSFDTNSDFAPLLEYINFLFANDGEGFKIILKEHLPFTYKNKIEKLK